MIPTETDLNMLPIPPTLPDKVLPVAVAESKTSGGTKTFKLVKLLFVCDFVIYYNERCCTRKKGKKNKERLARSFWFWSK